MSRDAKANDLEIEYAKKYPARANHFYWNFTFGEPHLKLKSLLVRTVAAITDSVTNDLLDPACKQAPINMTKLKRLTKSVPGLLNTLLGD